MANTQNQWPWKVEYARSSKSSCRTCKNTIEIKKLRLGRMVQSTLYDGRMPLWHHADCLLKKANQIKSIDDVVNLVDLRWQDQQRIREYIENESTQNSNAVKDTECDVEAEEVKKRKKKSADCGQKSKVAKVKEDMDAGSAPSTENADDSGEACYAMNRLKTQCNKLWALKDKLEKLVTKPELHEMLKANDQYTKGSKLDLRDRCADGMMFGALGRCPLCSGFLDYSLGMYQCREYISVWGKCPYSTVEPKRVEGKWRIPEETRNPYLKKWFRYQKEKKPVRILSLRSSRIPDETPCPPYSESLEDLKVAISGLPLKSIEDWKRKLDGVGGVLHPKVQNDTNCLVVSGAFNDGTEMNNARLLKIPIVREEYLVDSFERNKKLPFDMYKAEITNRFPRVHCAVHEDSGLQDSCHILQEGESKYTTTLIISDLFEGTNSYYILQIIQEDKGSVCYVFRKWGRVGEDNTRNNMLQEMQKDDAIRNFKELFFKQTANHWQDWEQKTFQKKPGKFFPLDIDYKVNEEILEIKKINADSKLSPKLKTLMEMLFNEETYRAVLKKFKIDTFKMPLGNMSKRSIQKGFEALEHMENLLKSRSVKEHLLTNASSWFFTVIPSTRPYVIRDEDDFKSKVKMLEDIQYIEIASSFDGFHKSIDDNYKNLQCRISPLSHDNKDFRLVEKFLKTTHAPTHKKWRLKLEEVFSLEREGEFDKFAPHGKNLGNKMLLWHGSRLTNFMGILRRGLMMAPPEAPSTGYMFGKGIYFSDLASKSARYCYTDEKNPVGLMLLSEVALGNVYEINKAECMVKPPEGKHSTKGLGLTIPQESEYVKWRGDVTVPCGKLVSSNINTSELKYNEYIVYNPDQVKMRFLLKVRFHHRK